MEQFKGLRMFARYGRKAVQLQREYVAMMSGLCPRCSQLARNSAGNLDAVETLCSVFCPDCRRNVERHTARMDEICGGKLGGFIKSRKDEKPVSSIGVLNPGMQQSSSDGH